MSSVYDSAREWARATYPTMSGERYTANQLHAHCVRLLTECTGLPSKKWLFLYTPDSLIDLYEMGADLMRMIVGKAKLGTMADSGGMLVCADFSTGWATPQCAPKFSAIVCHGA